MLIPLNTKKSNNLCLSVVTRDRLYSVAIVEVLNGFGMDNISSNRCYDADDEEVAPVIAMTEYPLAVGTDENLCIMQCITQLKLAGEL